MLIMFQEKIVVGKIFSKFQKFFDNELKFDAIILILFEFLSNPFYFKIVWEIVLNISQCSNCGLLHSVYLILSVIFWWLNHFPYNISWHLMCIANQSFTILSRYKKEQCEKTNKCILISGIRWDILLPSWASSN